MAVVTIPPNPRIADENSLSPEARALWRWLLDAGGWWTAAEAGRVSGLRLNQRRTEVMLRCMASMGCVVKRVSASESEIVYGVTAACTPPRYERMPRAVGVDKC